jgi:hypothetical protein
MCPEKRLIRLEVAQILVPPIHFSLSILEPQLNMLLESARNNASFLYFSRPLRTPRFQIGRLDLLVPDTATPGHASIVPKAEVHNI